MTRHDYFLLVYKWYVALQHTYNDLIFAVFSVFLLYLLSRILPGDQWGIVIRILSYPESSAVVHTGHIYNPVTPFMTDRSDFSIPPKSF